MTTTPAPVDHSAVLHGVLEGVYLASVALATGERTEAAAILEGVLAGGWNESNAFPDVTFAAEQGDEIVRRT